jgi:phosphoribosylformylglycinamidine synthase subunit PurS
MGGCGRMAEWGMVFSVQVDIQLRPGIADPQGSTIERSLPALGFAGVSQVRVGKSIRFRLEAPDEPAARGIVEDLCERFLANPVIETAQVDLAEVLEGASA